MGRKKDSPPPLDQGTPSDPFAFTAFDGATTPTAVASIPVAPEVVDRFFDSKISTATFAKENKLKKADKVRKFLPGLFRAVSPKLFSMVGQVASFDMTTPDYDVRHSISYYIPNSYKPDGTAPVLFVMHGGGQSTSTYKSARDTSQQYLASFTSFSEKNGVILVAPSSSVGWSYVLRILVRRVRTAMLQDLAINPDRIYFWGHSMGGMGLVRESHWLAGLAAASMPNAAGMQDGAEGGHDNFQIDPFFKTYFDLKVVHSNGKKDGFTAFMTRTLKVNNRMRELEYQLGQASGYSFLLEDRDHNPDMAEVDKLMEGNVLKLGRNLYQKSIYPLMGRVDTKNHRLGPDVDGFTINDYFWIEAPNLRAELGRQEFEQGELENFTSMQAKVVDNVYDIDGVDSRIKSLRILISKSMVNLKKRITIRVNGQVRFHHKVKENAIRMLEIARQRGDRSFIFENAVDLTL